MGIILILGAILILGLMFGSKSDKQLSDEASKLPPFTKQEAEQYYKDFDYWNKGR